MFPCGGDAREPAAAMDEAAGLPRLPRGNRARAELEGSANGARGRLRFSNRRFFAEHSLASNGRPLATNRKRVVLFRLDDHFDRDHWD